MVLQAFVRRRAWTDKEEFLDIVYWFRQAVALLCGLLLGALGATGIVTLLMGIGLNVAGVLVFASSYHGVDVDQFGGTFEIATEGFKESFALFLVSWILSYNIFFL
eukprot:m.103297 g.103297  ORF g.103297 m.103297 type:complete len:106 (-) comp51566_c0_seq1:123-440(-)